MPTDTDVELGHQFITPQGEPRPCRHSTRHCPHVDPDYQWLAPGDAGYSHIITVLEECSWCQKYRYGLVTPL